MLYVPIRPHIDCLRMRSPIQVVALVGMLYEYVSVFDMDAKRYLNSHKNETKNEKKKNQLTNRFDSLTGITFGAKIVW